MSILIPLLALTFTADAGRKSAKSKRLKRLAEIERTMLDEPTWTSGETSEERETITEHLSGCAEGEQEDCVELGIVYAEGEHVVQDFDRAVAHLRKS